MSERKRLRELNLESRSPDKLFDANLFLAQLKQPKSESGKNYDMSEDKNLGAVNDMLQWFPTALMELEGFFREKLANDTPYIKYKKVPEFLDKLDEIVNNIDTAIDMTERARIELSIPNPSVSVLDLFKASSGNSLYDIFDSVRSFLIPLKALVEDFEDYLTTIYNLYADNDENVLIGHKAPDKSGGELIKALSKLGFGDLAHDYMVKVGKAVFSSQMTDNDLYIDLRNRKLKFLYQQLADIYEDAYDKLGEHASDNDDVYEFLEEALSNLSDSLHKMIHNGINVVKACIELRSKLEPLGYKSPSKECAFYLTRDVTEHAVTKGELTDIFDIKEIPSELTFPLFFNDIAYAIHRVAEMLIYLDNYIARLVGNLNSHIFKLDKCSVPVYSVINKGELLNFATAWLNTICTLIENDWVAPGDRDYPIGYIISDTNAWFRVGSAYDHATHVRKEGDTWIIRYYDTDKPVNEILARLWGAVPNTEVEVLDYGVLAKTKDKEALPFLGALLGFVTSMDVNLEREGAEKMHQRMVELASQVSSQLALLVKKALGV